MALTFNLALLLYQIFALAFIGAEGSKQIIFFYESLTET